MASYNWKQWTMCDCNIWDCNIFDISSVLILLTRVSTLQPQLFIFDGDGLLSLLIFKFFPTFFKWINPPRNCDYMWGSIPMNSMQSFSNFWKLLLENLCCLWFQNCFFLWHKNYPFLKKPPREIDEFSNNVLLRRPLHVLGICSNIF